MNPDAVSPVGAEGIAQFMPQTWAAYGNGGDPFNPDDAIAAMGRYMASVSEQVSDLAGNERELAELALAAYNAGPGAVQSAGESPALPRPKSTWRPLWVAHRGTTLPIAHPWRDRS